MQPKSAWDWFGAFCLWLGAAVLAVKSAAAPLMPGAPTLFVAAFWNYVPVVLVSVSLVVFIYRQIRPFRSETMKPTEFAERAKPGLQGPPLPLAEAKQLPPHPDDLAYLPANVTPVSIFKLRSNLTGAQADRLCSSYVGKWMRVQGIVTLTGIRNERSMIGLKPHGPDTLGSITLVFDTQMDEVDHIEDGQSINAEGEVGSIGNLGILLIHARLLP